MRLERLARRPDFPSPSCYVAWQPASWFSPRLFAIGRSRPATLDWLHTYRVHGVVGCGSRSLRLPVSTSQHFRHFRVDWLPSTTVLGARMEARPTSKTPCFPLLDYVSAHMHGNRCELELASPTRTGLGIREACQWLGTKITLRCLVRLVRCRWFVTVSREMAKAFRLRLVAQQLRLARRLTNRWAPLAVAMRRFDYETLIDVAKTRPASGGSALSR